jgi:hypothetical protein
MPAKHNQPRAAPFYKVNAYAASWAFPIVQQSITIVDVEAMLKHLRYK